MEEADKLCDRIGIIDQGKIIALDTPGNFKNRWVETWFPSERLTRTFLRASLSHAARCVSVFDRLTDAERSG